MRKQFFNVHDQRGFTLLEMIGVLAVIGLLAALILPKVFEVIGESRVTGLASAARTYETAITNYFKDIGSILPLDAGGTPAVEATGDSTTVTSLPARLTLDSQDPLNTGANLWRKFRGPYLEKFDSASPPGGVGATMDMPAVAMAVALAAPVTVTNIAWDLKGDDGNNDIPVGDNVVYWEISGLTQSQFLALDEIIDREIGTTAAVRVVRGRAKFDAATGIAKIYLAHR